MSTGKTYQLDILTNHVNSMYQIGEPVVFSPSVGCDSICLYRGSVEWKISTDDSIVLKTGKADLALPGDSAEIILGHPGFVVCECVFKPEDADPVSAKHGVAVGACKIMPSMAAPADFDAFWELQKRRLSDIPMTCEIKKLPSPHVNLFDVKISCLDKIPASGLLALPRNCPPKSCPAFIFLHGAGVYTSSHATPVQLAMSGYMAMDLNAHGLPNLMEPEYYIGKSKGELFEYE